MSSSKYTKHHEEWKRLYEKELLSLREIAKIYGCSTTCVRIALVKMGVEMRLSGKAIGKKLACFYEEWKKLYVESFLSTQEIAEIYRCSDVNVLSGLKRLGVEIRNTRVSHKFKHLHSEWGKLYTEKKLSTILIGDIYGCSPDMVNSALINMGVQMRRSDAVELRRKTLKRIPTSSHDEEWMTLYQDYLLPTSEIGAIYGVSANTVLSGLNRMGVDTSRSNAEERRQTARNYYPFVPDSGTDG